MGLSSQGPIRSAPMYREFDTKTEFVTELQHSAEMTFDAFDGKVILTGTTDPCAIVDSGLNMHRAYVDGRDFEFERADDPTAVYTDLTDPEVYEMADGSLGLYKPSHEAFRAAIRQVASDRPLGIVPRERNVTGITSERAPVGFVPDNGAVTVTYTALNEGWVEKYDDVQMDGTRKTVTIDSRDIEVWADTDPDTTVVELVDGRPVDWYELEDE